MGIADWLGLGGQAEMFTDWNSARDFVIFQTIVNNPRISQTEKINLQKLEEQAYAETHGQLFVSEREEIGQYFNYLNNNAKAYTTDTKLLNVFAVGADASADVADTDRVAGINPLDAVASGSRSLALVALFGLGLFYVFSKK